MRKFLSFASLTMLAGLLATSALAADVTGKWTAQVPGRQGNTTETTINLKADGSTLTGSISTPRGDSDIKDGKVDGDNISFNQTFERGGNSMTIKYKGKVSSDGNSIEFTREMEFNGNARSSNFTAKRAK